MIEISFHLEKMRANGRTILHLALRRIAKSLILLHPCLNLKHLPELFHNLVCILFLKLDLIFRSHSSQHEARDIIRIVQQGRIFEYIILICFIPWYRRERRLQDMCLSFLFQNESQIPLPVEKVLSVHSFPFQNGTQTKAVVTWYCHEFYNFEK